VYKEVRQGEVERQLEDARAGLSAAQKNLSTVEESVAKLKARVECYENIAHMLQALLEME
jgi:hypothetical protein